LDFDFFHHRTPLLNFSSFFFLSFCSFLLFFLLKPVAIKQIFTADADYDVNFYFSREVEILGSISHPNIVGLLGVSHDGKDLYMITELIEVSY